MRLGVDGGKRDMTDRLKSKNCIIYGAAGGLGSGIAKAFAREGANLFLAGRTVQTLERVAGEIGTSDGSVQVAVVDAFDERAVEDHAQSVISQAGAIDVSFNLITRGDVQGIPLVEMTAEQLLRPVTAGLRSQFSTATVAARQMVRQGSGVILFLTSGSSQGLAPNMGGTGAADAATESFMRSLAAEVGRNGVRVAGIWTAGVPETFSLEDDSNESRRASGLTANQIEEMIGSRSMLGRAPRLAQVAETATFLASDAAAAITGTVVNATCGLVA
jgi:NAD(P)-dependent dehydrogenase (short-subunit alcohol dehydrogenase family)